MKIPTFRNVARFRLVEDLEMLRSALSRKGRCRHEGNWILDRRARWLHTLKAVVAVLLRREEASPDAYDWVEVAVLQAWTWTSMEFGTMHDWETLCVPHGWRRWRFCVRSDGAP